MRDMTMEMAMEQYMFGEAFEAKVYEADTVPVAVQFHKFGKLDDKSKRARRRKATVNHKKHYKKLLWDLYYPVEDERLYSGSFNKPEGFYFPAYKLRVTHWVYSKLEKRQKLERILAKEDVRNAKIYLGQILPEPELEEDAYDVECFDEKYVIKAELFQEMVQKYSSMPLNQILDENPSATKHPWVAKAIYNIIETLAFDACVY